MQIVLLENITSILPRINVEVTKNVHFNVICVYFRQFLMKNLEMICLVGWTLALREKCLYAELFWSAFSRIRTEYEEIRSISPYSVRMRENVDQNNSEYGHFLQSVGCFYYC